MGTTQFDGWDRQLRALTKQQAIAIAFVDTPPEGVRRHQGTPPSGCTFWKLAASSEPFYAEASAHLGCALGAYTHGAELSAENMQELSSLIGTMVGVSYLKQEEVPHVPKRTAPLRYVVYGPLGKIPVAPDVVLVRGNARQLMVLTEAGRAAGHLNATPTMGRPACAMIPQCIASNEMLVSLGCTGNRVYTEIADDEGYVSIAGPVLATTMERLATIVTANEAIEAFHRERMTRASAET
jgi:uncharacterized protein (DUF169 family)